MNEAQFDREIERLRALPRSKRGARHVVWVKFEGRPRLAVTRRMKGTPKKALHLCRWLRRTLRQYHLDEIRIAPDALWLSSVSVQPAMPDVSSPDLCPCCAALYSLAALELVTGGIR